MGLFEKRTVLLSKYNDKEGTVMITLIVLTIKLMFWIAFLPLQIILLPLTLLAGGSKTNHSSKKNMSDEEFLTSAAFLDETIDDYWWQ